MKGGEDIMPTIARNGVKLAFEDRGAGKPAFVFVHGTACDRSFLAPQAEHFARQHRVVSVDLRTWRERQTLGAIPDRGLCR
jgi:pimeloyl-ACP methyl ester carboxylesterase